MATTGSLTHITAFEVPPDADDDFIAGWPGPGARRAVLHRALRPDADFRFVEVAQDAGADPSAAFTAHAGAYRVVREDGAVDTPGGVVLINPFEVPEQADESFLAGWDRARESLAQQQGYIGTRLHRSVGAADFRFVNIARWSSPLMFARALTRPEFRDAAAAMPFASHPALYEVVRT